MIPKGYNRREPVQGHDSNDAAPKETRCGARPPKAVPADMHHDEPRYNKEDIHPGVAQNPRNARKRILGLAVGKFKQDVIGDY